jgi:hypothetical protein
MVVKQEPHKPKYRSMYRLPRPDNPKLAALLGERDHIRVRLSLRLDANASDTEIAALYDHLDDLERHIRAERRISRKNTP